MRLRLIKTYVTKHYREQLEINAEISLSRQKRKEKNLWQRRFWEHLIRDQQDYALHSIIFITIGAAINEAIPLGAVIYPATSTE